MTLSESKPIVKFRLNECYNNLPSKTIVLTFVVCHRVRHFHHFIFIFNSEILSGKGIINSILQMRNLRLTEFRQGAKITYLITERAQM